jgi:porin
VYAQVLFYNFEHYLYTMKIRLCGDSVPSADLVFSTARPLPPILQLGLGGKGVIPGREKDQFGVGYYYVQISNHLPHLLRNRLGWIASRESRSIATSRLLLVHFTPDVQTIGPARRDADTLWLQVCVSSSMVRRPQLRGERVEKTVRIKISEGSFE